MLLCACGEEQVAGPCLHTYHGPVLTLTRATLDGRPAERVVILSMRHDGAAVELTDTSGLEIGPQGGVWCTLPCGFGEHPGQWQVTVRGPDGSRGSVDVQADYADGEGGCPSSSFDGADVAVTLSRSGHGSS